MRITGDVSFLLLFLTTISSNGSGGVSSSTDSDNSRNIKAVAVLSRVIVIGGKVITVITIKVILFPKE